MDTDELSLRGGATLLALLMVVPVINCVTLLTDTNLGFWVGTGTAFGWLFLSILLVVGYAVVMSAFTRKAFGEPRGRRTLDADERHTAAHVGFMMLRTFFLIIGLFLIWQKFEIEDAVTAQAQILTESCESEGRSSVLHNYYKQLQAIRNDESCAGKLSVTECTGWVSNDWSRYLLWAEGQFECTGVCPETVARLSPVAPVQPEPERQRLAPVFSAPEPVGLESPAPLAAVEAATPADIQNAGAVPAPAQPATAGRPTQPQAAPGTTDIVPAGSMPSGPAPANPLAGVVGGASSLVHEHHHRLRNRHHTDHEVRLGLTERIARLSLSTVVRESMSLLEEAAGLGDLEETAGQDVPAIDQVVPQVTQTQPLGVDSRGTTLGGVMGAAAAGSPIVPESAQPNALFSRAHYEHKCGTMIAMDLKTRGQSMADANFAAGISLIGVMIFSACLELAVFLSRGKEERPPQ